MARLEVVEQSHHLCMRILAVAGMGAVHYISPENIVRSCDGFPPNFISFADEFGGRMLDFLQLRFLGKNSSDDPALTCRVNVTPLMKIQNSVLTLD